MSKRTLSLTLLFLCAGHATALAQSCALERMTHGLNGQLSNGDCEGASPSWDARFVSFASVASNLVSGDTNGVPDCFVTDRVTDTTEMVSVNSGGVQGNGKSILSRITPDGRFVTFLSESTNLDPQDTDTLWDVYIHDRLNKTTELVSVRQGIGLVFNGCISAEPSASGRWVLFDCSDANVLPGVLNYNAFVRDTWLGTTELVSSGPNGQVIGGASIDAAISGDGRYVAFTNIAVDWHAQGSTALNAMWIRDRVAGTTRAITVNSSGQLANGGFVKPRWSVRGRYLVFASTSSDLLPPGQPHGIYDIVRWDRLTDEFKTVSVDPFGLGLNNLCRLPSISADGTKVVYYTDADNATINPGSYKTIVLVHVPTGAAQQVNVNAAGEVSNKTSYLPAISPDGKVVAFSSYASNLVSLPSNGATEIYVRSCDVSSPMTYCALVPGSTGCTMRIGSTGQPSASAGQGFDLQTSGVPAQQPAMFFHGTTAPWGKPYNGAFVCVKSPVQRTPGIVSGGTTACDGVLSLDFNSLIASGVDPMLVAGSPVYVQSWARNSAGSTQLSDALAFELKP